MKLKKIKGWSNLYYNIIVLYVWPFIDSAPEHHTELRLASLEPVWHEEGHRLNFFSKNDQWLSYHY
jgi:hypothetical protein